MFDTVVSNAVKWWCMRKDLMQPDPQSEVYEKYKRQALIKLTSKLANCDLLTVLMTAAQKGALELLQRILHVPKVYVFQDEFNFIFDVTDLTHETMGDIPQTREKKPSRVSPNNKVSAVSLSETGQQDKTTQSCLDLIVGCPNVQMANQMLDIIPIKQVVSDYWSAYQWIYGVLMLVHLIYMSLLSAFGIPLIKETVETHAWPYVLFLLWPIVLLVFEIYYFSINILHFFSKRNNPSGEISKQRQNSISKVLTSVFRILMRYLAHFTSLAFTILVITWFSLYYTKSRYQAHVLAVSLVLGWLYTIAFTDGFETVHAFTIMLKKIIIRDMTRFLFLYLLVLFAFALAFQCLFSIAENVEAQYPTAWSTFFITFNMMIGMGEIFYDEFDDDYASAVRKDSATFVKILYLVYILLTTVILLNLLIAMMTDSYVAVKLHEGTTWRVGSVQLAIEIEKNMPFLPKFFKFVGIKHNPLHYDPDTQRWKMSIPKQEVSFRKDLTRENAMEAIGRLEKEIRDMKVQYSDINDNIQLLMEKSYEQTSLMGRPSSGRTGLSKFRRSVAALQSNPRLERRRSIVRHGESDLLKFQQAGKDK